LPLSHRRFARLLPLSQKPTHSHVRCSSASRLLSVQGRVLRVRLFTSPVPAPLLSFFSSRPSFLSTSAPIYSAPSAHDVPELGSSRAPIGLSGDQPCEARFSLAAAATSKRRLTFRCSVISAPSTFRRPSPRASSTPACAHLSVLTAPSFLRSKSATTFRWLPLLPRCVPPWMHTLSFAITLRFSRLTITVARSPTASCHRECLVSFVSDSDQPARVFEPSIRSEHDTFAPCLRGRCSRTNPSRPSRFSLRTLIAPPLALRNFVSSSRTHKTLLLCTPL
jgi:hypothetical protein